MMFADSLEALGLKRGDYLIKVSSRKVLDGVMDNAKVDLAKRGTVLRAIDKIDRLGFEGVRALLGPGRKDASGDVTPGAGLSGDAIAAILNFTGWGKPGSSAVSSNDATIANIEDSVRGSAVGEAGVAELAAIKQVFESCRYGREQILIDPSVVRGLDYYTGPVFEAQLTFPVRNDAGDVVVFGSVGGGGRYDDLIARFTGQSVPASGFSLGVSRLAAALKARAGAAAVEPLVVVMVLDKAAIAESFRMAQELRAAGLRAEAYVGEAGMKAQLKYADKRNAAIAVIEGSDERARGEVTLKDLALGAELAKSTDSRAAWVKDRPAQTSVRRTELVQAVRAMLGERGG
jgi:histidyl-tRNA synthetase